MIARILATLAVAVVGGTGAGLASAALVKESGPVCLGALPGQTPPPCVASETRYRDDGAVIFRVAGFSGAQRWKCVVPARQDGPAFCDRTTDRRSK